MDFSQTLQFTREMKRGEEDAVDALLRAAFPGSDEAGLVRNLRKSKTMAGEMVMPSGDGIVAYYALSYMVQPKGWLCLAPVAVHPNKQRCGYGKRMIGMLAEWARMSKTPVVVLGNPEFYSKAGFSSEHACNLETAHPIKSLLIAGVATAPAVKLIYPKPFDSL